MPNETSKNFLLVASFNGPIMVRVGNVNYALGRNVASVIWVKRS
jgi:Fe2+ transport system protein FeoA